MKPRLTASSVRSKEARFAPHSRNLPRETFLPLPDSFWKSDPSMWDMTPAAPRRGAQQCPPSWIPQATAVGDLDTNPHDLLR
ncbi:hypothetical protein J7T55_014103 [Diaporthe amygdali]|uniref:uncharacterized protein n=1 Tax=Phomopsis amygdali TaxID=1214568 RepID=UPI0022FEA7B6|nr:uncharacterized protein J7T55_014103 [Diaporthe amygdali]KAJ0109541.1 hypothetical protein J7T55_014103 [Diaporthe amygdali]